MTTPPPIPPAPQGPHLPPEPQEGPGGQQSSGEPHAAESASGVPASPAQQAYGYPPPPPTPGYGQQPYGQPPYGQPQGVPAFTPPPRKSSKKGWIIGGSIAAVVLLLCCGCFGVGGWLMYKLFEEERESAEQLVVEYFTDLEEQRYGEAYSALCQRVRSDVSQAEYLDEVSDTDDRIVDHSVQDSYLGDGQDSTYVVKVRVTRGDTSKDTLRVDVNDRDEVCSRAW